MLCGDEECNSAMQAASASANEGRAVIDRVDMRTGARAFLCNTAGGPKTEYACSMHAYTHTTGMQAARGSACGVTHVLVVASAHDSHIYCKQVLMMNTMMTWWWWLCVAGTSHNGRALDDLLMLSPTPRGALCRNKSTETCLRRNPSDEKS